MIIVAQSVDPKVIGRNPEVKYDSAAYKNGDVLFKDVRQNPGFSKQSFLPLIATGGTKMCDNLFNSIGGFPNLLLVSNRLADIFMKYSGQSSERGSIKIKQRDKNYNYAFIGMTERLPDEIIDFDNSKIALLNWMEQRYDPLTCATLEEFKETDSAVFVNVAFNHELIKGLHYFVCPVLNKMFISDEMAEAMVKAKITGLELYEYDESSDITQNALRKLPRVL